MSPKERTRVLEEALVFHRANEFEKAEEIYAEVRKKCPREFDPWFLSGAMAYQRGGHLDFSIELLEQARKINPVSDSGRLFLGMAYADKERFSDAAPLLLRALKKLPQYPEAWENLARCQIALGQYEEAVTSLQQFVNSRPTDPNAHAKLGEAVARVQGVVAAQEHFRAAIDLDPEHVTAWNNLGVALLEQPGKLAEGLEAIDKALVLQPGFSEARTARFLALLRLYRVEEAFAAAARAVGRASQQSAEAQGFASLLALMESAQTSSTKFNAQDWSAYCLTQNYRPEISREALFAIHQEFGNSFLDFSAPDFPNEKDLEKKLRIGFVSPDFRRHSVAFFLLPLLRNLDRQDFSVFLYFTGSAEDSMSAEFKKLCSKWINLNGKDNAQAIALIRKDAPDILVDLAGHYAENRLPLFVEHLAPVQVTYLGYPNTTGLPAITHRFVDEYSDVPGEADGFATEKLVRFSSCAWCYEPPEEVPAPVFPSGSKITFGSFNNFLKVNAEVLAAWKEILDQVPDSRLLLKSPFFDDPAAAKSVRTAIQSAGIDLERVELRGMYEKLVDHLAAYEEVDVALDPFPYHGTTTTCEALWMGVPVVTLVGDRHASRVGFSLLTAIGHAEWACANRDAYIQTAVDLARNVDLRKKLRASLREEMASSVLCNAPEQSKKFFGALRDLWRAWCASSPASEDKKTAE